MRTDDPTVLPDVRRIVWETAGCPARPTSWPTYAVAADALRDAAVALRDALDAYIADADRIARWCHETPRCPCGASLPVRSTGRPSAYCSDACRKRAERTRTTKMTRPSQSG